MEMTRAAIVRDAKERMAKAVEHLESDLKGLRTGRATPGLVDHIKVDYYGSMTPISQLAQVSVPDAKTIVVKPFDQTQLGAIEKAIQSSGLGITPQGDGKQIRLPLPMMTQEQRKKLALHVKDLSEKQRIAVRNIRRDSLKHVQQGRKDSVITEDEEAAIEKEVTDLTKRVETEIDAVVKKKTAEIETV